MSKTPSQVLSKYKSEKKETKENDNDKDDKKTPRRNALLDFIAKAKKSSKKE